MNQLDFFNVTPEKTIDERIAEVQIHINLFREKTVKELDALLNWHTDDGQCKVCYVRDGWIWELCPEALDYSSALAARRDE